MSVPENSYSGVDEAARRRFEAAWIEGRPRSIHSFLPAEDDARYLATLEELVHIELEFAWRSWRAERGAGAREDPTPPQPLRVERYLERYERLNEPSIAARLIEQECRVRRQAGGGVSIEEYRRRFPQLVVTGGQLDSALQTIAMAGSDAAAAKTVAAGGPAAPAARGSDEARRLGNYELLEEIGRGGMGVVYRARQTTADRIVALKVIRRDWLESMPPDTRAGALDRFRHEAQAAARIEHENIVTVYEVGEVEGEPFFSMRYVDGHSLADIVQDGPIAPQLAAAYLEPVARAVDEAHRRGILHRDLKPQNILVDRQTDVALVADFGLAKLLQTGDELTCAGEVIGSPAYMSPEQARDSSHVTTQSDVYALGATLYHLLTGRPPFRAASVAETLSNVMFAQPAPPRQLDPAVDRDLETICLKCLEKESSRRYVSAAALADDLRRYRNDEPIEARPVSAWERVWRWGRRNPLAATLIASTAFFLMLALAASIVGYVKTSTALDQAQRRHRETREVINKFFTRVSEDRLLNEPGMQPLRKELLEEVLPYYQSFLDEFADDPAIRDELAVTHFRVGRITEMIGSPEDARAWYARARDIQETLLDEQPDDPRRLAAMGDTLTAMGRILHRQSRFEETRDAYQQAIQIRTRLAQAEPNDDELQRTLANSRMNLGLLEKDVGHAQEAIDQYRRAQEIRRAVLDEHPRRREIRRDLGIGYYNQAVLALALASPDEQAPDRYADAAQYFQQAIAVFESLLQGDPDDLSNQRRLVLCGRLLADLQCAQGDLDAGLARYQNVLRRLEILALRNPEVPEYQADLAGLHLNLGLLQKENGKTETARENLRKGLELLQQLVVRHPEVPRYRRDLAAALRERALLHKEAGEIEQAREDLERARRYLTELVKEFPENTQFHQDLEKTPATLDRLPASPDEKK